jgi:hypothetical protein
MGLSVGTAPQREAGQTSEIGTGFSDLRCARGDPKAGKILDDILSGPVRLLLKGQLITGEFRDRARTVEELDVDVVKRRSVSAEVPKQGSK